MTEDEAKKKWCPFVRAVNGQVREDGSSSHAADQGPYNRVVDSTKWAFPVGAACLGSACMAWRWADEIERRWTAAPPEGEGWQRVEAIGGVAHYARTHQTPHGYCGLAGKP